jgi:serine/threonine protein kinase/WD40 repeat protein
VSDLDQTLDPPPDDDELPGGFPDHTLDLPPADDDDPSEGLPEHTLDLLPEAEREARSASLETPDHTLDLAPDDAQAGADASRDQVSLPGYDLVKKLGSGATGNVWEAVQSSTGQRVAVKVLGRLTRSQDQLFKKEMEQLIALSGHNHIVGLLDANLEHNPPFLVMPLFHQSLEFYTVTRANLGLLTNVRVSRWFAELAAALRYVHQRGILHCDVKPPNVLLDRDQAKLVDFGQAALVKQGEARLGTFFYMPPEQARVGSDPKVQADATWDVYSLGATIYHLLTGQPPRHSDSIDDSLSRASNVTEQLGRYAEELASAPLAPVRQLNSQTDPDLASIVEKCLQIDGDQRYQDMGSLLNDLDRRVKNLPLSSRAHTAPYILRKWTQRNPVLLCLLLVSAGLVGLAFHRVQQAYHEADVRRIEAGQAKARSEELAHQAVLSEAIARLDRQRASGAAMLAKLASLSPGSLTHMTQLADSVRHLPFPLYRQRALDACWNGQTLYYLDDDKVWAREADITTTRNLGEVRANLWRRLLLDPAGERLLIWGERGWELREIKGWKLLLQGDERPEETALSATHLALSKKNLIKVWKLSSDAEPKILVHHDRVTDFCFAPQGGLLASASDDRTCRLWPLDDPESRSLLWHNQGVTAVFFDPGGSRLVSCSRSGQARIWEVKSGRQLGPGLEHDSPVKGGTFSPDGSRLLTFGSRGGVKIWSPVGQAMGETAQTAGAVNSISFNHSQDTVLTASGRQVWFWDATTGEQRYRPVELGDAALRPSWSSDGQLLAGVEAGFWRVWELASVRPIPRKLVAGRGLRGIQFSADDSTMAVVLDGKVQLYKTHDRTRLGEAINIPGVREVRLVSGGRYLIAYGWRTELWDLKEGSSSVLRLGSDMIDIAPNGEDIGVTGAGPARVISTNSTAPTTTIPINDTDFVTFSTEDRKVLFSNGRGSLVYDLESGESQKHPSMQSATFLSRQHIIFFTGKDLMLEDLSGQEETRRLFSGLDRVVLNPSAGRAHAALRDGTLVLLNDEGKLLDFPRLTIGEDSPIAFSPDGVLLATARGRDVKVWWCEDGRAFTDWVTCSDDIQSLCINSPRTMLAAALADGTVRFIPIGFDADQSPRLAELEVVRRSGWKADAQFRPLADDLRDKEWRDKATAHAHTCVYTLENFWLRWAGKDGESVDDK